MDSESQYEESEIESEASESEETTATLGSEDEPTAQEKWETFAGLTRRARGMGRLEALDTVLPHLPNGPQASALEHALLTTNSMPTTLRAVEKAALAMARAEELVRLA
jgi:hypothetical protein